eukprot:GHVU01005060.1.p1 GENE.GHVU01005060.1~~GHVU01005060.1.p1  ORF type:complete len:206 (-),score=36.98 GHVU01005060.1:52-669(-)
MFSGGWLSARTPAAIGSSSSDASSEGSELEQLTTFITDSDTHHREDIFRKLQCMKQLIKNARSLLEENEKKRGPAFLNDLGNRRSVSADALRKKKERGRHHRRISTGTAGAAPRTSTDVEHPMDFEPSKSSQDGTGSLDITAVSKPVGKGNDDILFEDAQSAGGSSSSADEDGGRPPAADEVDHLHQDLKAALRELFSAIYAKVS